MFRILSFSVFFLWLSTAFSQGLQKPIIDSFAIVGWPSLSLSNPPEISDNGSYISYFIENDPIGSQTLVIQNINKAWSAKIPGASSCFFTSDSKIAVIQKADSLIYFQLTSSKSTIILKVNSIKSPEKGEGEWLAYFVSGSPNELVLCNLNSGKNNYFNSVVDYSFDKWGKYLLLKKCVKNSVDSSDILQIVDLSNGSTQTILSESMIENDYKIGGYSFDNDGAQVSFIITKNGNFGSVNSVWYYKQGMERAVMKVNDKSEGIDSGLVISNSSPFFSLNGQYIFFNIEFKDSLCKSNSSASSLDIWSYKDSVLQSRQLVIMNNPYSDWLRNKKYASVVNVLKNNILRIEQNDERIVSKESISKTYANFVVVKDNISISEHWWRSHATRSAFLISLEDGSRELLNTNCDYMGVESQYMFSPSGRFLIFFDPKVQVYFSIDVLSGKKAELTKGITEQLGNEYNHDGKTTPELPVGIGGWLENENGLFLYDNFDIWNVDPLGKRKPTNITNGYGKKTHIKIRLLGSDPFIILPDERSIVVTAFNISNKFTGFLEIAENLRDPKVLSMDSTLVVGTDDLMVFNATKAKEGKRWCLIKQNANDAPNIFYTIDFRKFERVSYIQPQREYNWLTSELICFKQLDGVNSQGLLYKPGNFNPDKKYPIIFYFYEKKSQSRFQYQRPEFAAAAINIPWFVSRGYLVFTGDIYYSTGKAGQSVYNSVHGAIQMLSQFSWIDSMRMGITGQSFGGYETNYLATHSKLFAAAISTSGFCNMINFYGGVLGMGGELYGQTYTEVNQFRMGCTLWERPDLYIENSPVFNIDQISMPILIMNNKRDPLVPWIQGIEFFTGLRRLQKKSWLLQYDNGVHAVFGSDQIDYTIRSSQFFDHYLKGYPPPKWMTQGRPAKLKQINDRFEFDPDGSCGEDCKICRERKYQDLEILDVMNPNTIKYRVDANMHVTGQSINPNQ